MPHLPHFYNCTRRSCGRWTLSKPDWSTTCCPQTMLPWTVHMMILLSQVHQKSCASQLNPIKTQLEHPPLLGTGGGRFAHNNRTAGGRWWYSSHCWYSVGRTDTQYSVLVLGVLYSRSVYFYTKLELLEYTIFLISNISVHGGLHPEVSVL